GEDHFLELHLQRLQLDGLEDVGGESVGEEDPRPLATYSAAVEIEHRLLIEPSHCRAVGALHVVGEYLELRLRIDTSAGREQKIVVALLSVRLLCLGVNVNLSVEYPVRAAVENSL